MRVAILDPKHCGSQLVNYQVHGLIEPNPSSSPLHHSMGFRAFVSDVDIASAPFDAIKEAVILQSVFTVRLTFCVGVTYA